MALTLILGGLIFGGNFVLVNRGGTYLRGLGGQSIFENNMNPGHFLSGNF